mmetsp:Transcript_4384/g.7538  ORF Transcript_4384/g.7538 Transcript_4384/m.7538 type:complete len:104 (-) Transcript_4384:263-574(-)
MCICRAAPAEGSTGLARHVCFGPVEIYSYEHKEEVASEQDLQILKPQEEEEEKEEALKLQEVFLQADMRRSQRSIGGANLQLHVTLRGDFGGSSLMARRACKP